ncbi:ATP-binding protein [Geobacter sp. DSM 9736]|uniref:ATP-binding protein n=1 Tax=Geobacter sp. DSM 9736 TaxID=1277350 RepID=UPI000B4FDE84|nr:ATP-binding protein [Geobacter sp. DSM 9736]SNB46836.1 PAS domain S-box-containing protein [Geobacter sp. DSM 9736]
MNDVTVRPAASIARQLFKAVLGVSTVLTLLFTGVQATYDYRASLRSINDRFEQIKRTNSPGISTALWGFDRQTLVSQAEGILHFPHIKYVEIRGNGAVIAAAGQRVSGESLTKEFALSYEYNGRPLSVGVLHLEADTSEIIRDIVRNIAGKFPFQFLSIALTSIFLLLMFNRLVTRHIVTAATHFRTFDVDGGASSLVLQKKDRGDELDVLAEAFNTLQERLATSYLHLRESEQRFKLATASGKLGVWDWDVRNDAMVWDERMLELYDISPGRFSGVVGDWVNSLHPDDKERMLAECRAALNGEGEFDTAFRVCRPDGTVRHIKANGVVIRESDGQAKRMIGINADITDQVRAQEERQTFETQLQQAQKMESVGRLAGGVAHDFNNMLSVILGRAELGLRHLPEDHPAHAQLAEICKTAQRSAELTRQLLAFARKQAVSPKVLDLNETISIMLKMLQRLIGEDIHLSWNPAPQLWQVRIDPSQIDQILANLCVNARDAIENSGRITIETENCRIDSDCCVTNAEATPGDYVRLTVSDNGIGMDPETRAHAFEPFFTTKALGKGTGLGLATVYGAVRQNNGFITVVSEPGRGTTFSVYLPRHEGSMKQPAERSPAPVPCGRETILLVEDEPAILEVSAKLLQEQGYAVIQAGTPEEAIQLATDQMDKIDLLMTDVIMPEMNGRDLANRLLTTHPGMKRLFMSGYTADVIAHHGVLDEGVHFIEKPFTLSALAAKVREVLDAETEPG